MTFRVTVDREKCTGCEECVEVCTAKVFEMVDRKASPVKTEECLGCESCVKVCKREAVSVTDSRVELSETIRSLFRDIL